MRELEEECGLKGKKIELVNKIFINFKFTVRGAPGRDPRKHVVSIFYVVEVDQNDKENAGDDAATCGFYKLTDVINQKEKFAFDHYEVLSELVHKKKLI